METATENKVVYKKTKLGSIPEDWKEVKLGDVAKFRRGSFPQPYGLPKWYDEENGHPFVQVYDVDDNMKLKPNTKSKISNLAAEHSVFVKKGSIVLTIQGSIGRIALTQYDSYVDRTLLIFTGFNEKVNVIFFMYVVQDLFEREKHKAPGGTIKTITKEVLSSFKIILAPFSEQQKIATILSTWDKAIDKLTKLIAAKEQRKKGLMQLLLTGKKRFAGFTEEWKEVKLGKVAKFRRGSFPQPYGLPKWYDEENGHPFVQVYDVDDNMKLKPNTKSKISNLAAEQSVFVKKGSIVLTIQGSIGRIALTQYDSYVDRTLLIFTGFNEKVNLIFFMYVVQDLFEREKHKAPGGTIKTITKEVLSSFKIILAPYSEQQKIASTLSAADKEIELLKQQLNNLQQQKKGLMQKLLTGEVRVKIN